MSLRVMASIAAQSVGRSEDRRRRRRGRVEAVALYLPYKVCHLVRTSASDQRRQIEAPSD